MDNLPHLIVIAFTFIKPLLPLFIFLPLTPFILYSLVLVVFILKAWLVTTYCMFPVALVFAFLLPSLPLPSLPPPSGVELSSPVPPAYWRKWQNNGNSQP